MCLKPWGILILMARTIVGVLRGGNSSEYDLSLKTGATILNALPEDSYDTRDILIDRAGVWYARGMPVAPMRALSQVDVVANALHGGIGEDGTIQRILTSAGVPFLGSDALGSSLSLNKARAVETLRAAQIPVARSLAFSLQPDIDTGVLARQVFAVIGPPYIVKPALEGASHGIAIAQTIVDLPYVLADALEKFGLVLVEEYLIGEDATVGIIEDFRGEELYALPPAHIMIEDEHPMLQYQHHLSGGHRHIVPSAFSTREKELLIDAARRAHRALGLSQFSRADFIMTKSGPKLLEVNSIPGLHEHASLPHMLESVGSSVSDFVGHAIGLSKRG